jgi:hypothetical protein
MEEEKEKYNPTRRIEVGIEKIQKLIKEYEDKYYSLILIKGSLESRVHKSLNFSLKALNKKFEQFK